MPPRWRPIPCSRATPHPTAAAVPGARQSYGGSTYCSCPWPGGVQGLPAIPSTTRCWCMAWRSAFWRSGLARHGGPFQDNGPAASSPSSHGGWRSLSHVRWHYGSIWRPHTRLSLRRRPDQTAPPPPVRPRIQSPFSRIKPRSGKARFTTSSPWYRRPWGGNSQWSWQAPCGRLGGELGRPRACCFWLGGDIWDAAGGPPAHSLVWQPCYPGIRSSQVPVPGHSGPVSRPRIAIHSVCCKSIRRGMGAVRHANLALLSWPPCSPQLRDTGPWMPATPAVAVGGLAGWEFQSGFPPPLSTRSVHPSTHPSSPSSICSECRLYFFSLQLSCIGLFHCVTSSRIIYGPSFSFKVRSVLFPFCRRCPCGLQGGPLALCARLYVCPLPVN